MKFVNEIRLLLWVPWASSFRPISFDRYQQGLNLPLNSSSSAEFFMRINELHLYFRLYRHQKRLAFCNHKVGFSVHVHQNGSNGFAVLVLFKAVSLHHFSPSFLSVKLVRPAEVVICYFHNFVWVSAYFVYQFFVVWLSARMADPALDKRICVGSFMQQCTYHTVWSDVKEQISYFNRAMFFKQCFEVPKLSLTSSKASSRQFRW